MIEQFVKIKRMRCPVCGNGMRVDRVSGTGDPTKIPTGREDICHLSVTYVCKGYGHAIRTEIDYTEEFMEEAD